MHFCLHSKKSYLRLVQILDFRYLEVAKEAYSWYFSKTLTNNMKNTIKLMKTTLNTVKCSKIWRLTTSLLSQPPIGKRSIPTDVYGAATYSSLCGMPTSAGWQLQNKSRFATMPYGTTRSKYSFHPTFQMTTVSIPLTASTKTLQWVQCRRGNWHGMSGIYLIII